MIMTAKAILDTNPNPSLEEIKVALKTNRNLCRCTGYVSIFEAIQLAAARMAGRASLEILPEARVLLTNPQLREEVVNKVTGACQYADDIEMEGMLHGAILWAAHPHARITSIDTSAAEAVPAMDDLYTRYISLEDPLKKKEVLSSLMERIETIGEQSERPVFSWDLELPRVPE